MYYLIIVSYIWDCLLLKIRLERNFRLPGQHVSPVLNRLPGQILDFKHRVRAHVTSVCWHWPAIHVCLAPLPWWMKYPKKKWKERWDEVVTAQRTSMKPTSLLFCSTKEFYVEGLFIQNIWSPWCNLHSVVLSRGFQNGIWEPEATFFSLLTSSFLCS